LSTALPPKQVVCECGHSFTSEQHSNWCTKCGRQVFYNPRDQRKARFNNTYIMLVIVAAFSLVAYFFIEMILTPILTHFQ
jgi:DNA-directed RNA polymerase subunit RPC12/RpoP